MAWVTGNQKIIPCRDLNGELMKLTGNLDDINARLTLAQFFRHNLMFTVQLFFKMKTFLPLQEFIIKSVLAKDNSLVVAARGLGKSTIIAVLSILLPILYPGCKVVLIATNFRTSRRILEEAEKIVKKSDLLQACFPNEMRKANDLFRWQVPCGVEISEVMALPLSTGQGLRGTRANFVIIDEALLIDKALQENILRPFLTAKLNAEHEMLIRQREDELIKKGLITDSDRMSFPKNKFIAFSSASFSFEYLAEMFETNVKLITNPDKNEKDPPTYFVCRLSYKAVPENNSFLDLTQIKAAAANGGDQTSSFKKEYMAIFDDASGSYFNVRAMHNQTVKAGEFPTTQIFGDKDAKYILSLDPSYSADKSSDLFSMAVFLLVPEERRIIQVHTYAKAGGQLKEHFERLCYILQFFNIEFIIIDDSGSEFIHGFNESSIAKERGLHLQFLDVDFEADNYLEQLSKAKNTHNKTTGKIVYGQKFVSQYIRKMNEFLQGQIQAGKVWFASPVGVNETAFKKYSNFTLPYKFTDTNDQPYSLDDFIRDQDYWINETKAQCALIEVKTTPMGNLQFDLPTSVKRSESKNRPRKDCYTTLLLGNYGAKLYFDFSFSEQKTIHSTFTPKLI